MRKNGFVDAISCLQDCLTSNIPSQCFHKLKTLYKQRSKKARFLHPDVAVKETHTQGGKPAYQLAHVSFQSTSSCNISTVNSLAQFKLQNQRKVRGRGDNKREWSIKINDAWSVYLATYFKIYLMYHLIKIVEYSIDHGSIRINQCSMKNPLQFLSYTKYTSGVHRVGLTVNGKFNTQLNSGHLDMCCPNIYCNIHRLINYSPVTRKWEPPQYRQKGSAVELQES